MPKYNFGDEYTHPISDLIDHIQWRSDQEDKSELLAKTQKDKAIHGAVRAELNYIKMMLENSNLLDMRWIRVDSELEDAKLTITEAIKALELICEDIQLNIGSLTRKAEELEVNSGV